MQVVLYLKVLRIDLQKKEVYGSIDFFYHSNLLM